ncbi:hypothetical protein SETIT_9G129600v2 [Setaria italica]|uniref:Uncharacterized protein n=1 Tax=Setaria italica TaxID=4555 RepID=K4AHI5_SETIT|nr:hypothetical protein SETIT_9G129600v2 [Setaria italica]
MLCTMTDLTEEPPSPLCVKDCPGVHVIGSLLAVFDLHVLILNSFVIVLGFLQGRISCVVHVNPHNQTIVHQDCYPE